ncbi:MAG: FecR domain-containing protein [Planctomycetota bacterium]
MKVRSENYLWDRSGEPDPEIVALEKLLAPCAHDGRPLELRRRPRVLPGLAAACVVLIGIGIWIESRPEPLELRVVGARRKLNDASLFVATESERELSLGGGVAELTLDVGSRLHIQALDRRKTRLYLERGGLTAFVSADARPRFFEVGTPAARCIDLGCFYTLEVDEDGDARVDVSFGQVAFQHGAREVYIPSGATCKASRETGPGTPRFSDCSTVLVGLLDAFDDLATAAPEIRRRSAAKVMASLETERDTLPVWHLLQDKDEVIASQAVLALGRVAGWPAGIPQGCRLMSQQERQLWKEHLLPAWGTVSFEERSFRKGSFGKGDSKEGAKGRGQRKVKRKWKKKGK